MCAIGSQHAWEGRRERETKLQRETTQDWTTGVANLYFANTDSPYNPKLWMRWMDASSTLTQSIIKWSVRYWESGKHKNKQETISQWSTKKMGRHNHTKRTHHHKKNTDTNRHGQTTTSISIILSTNANSRFLFKYSPIVQSKTPLIRSFRMSSSNILNGLFNSVLCSHWVHVSE